MTKLDFSLQGDPAVATEMAHYMKDKFIFAGVKTPERKAQSKDLIARSKKEELSIVHQWITVLYHWQEREYQYVAIDLAMANVRRWKLADLRRFREFVKTKSWWDTVDAWRSVYGKYIALHPAERAAVFGLLHTHTNIWERRIAITLQLMEKNNTDTGMLTKAITYDIDTDEFFIQKAIGWALRQYSKTDPLWVETFMAEHELRPLAKREGAKYLAS